MSGGTMTDAQALAVIDERGTWETPRCREALEHIAARLRGEAAPGVAVAGVAVKTAMGWLRSALDCGEFIWEEDQVKDAEAAYAEAIDALSAAPAAPTSPSIICEHCPTQFHGTDDAAEAGGWVRGWDGWECPAHGVEREQAPAAELTDPALLSLIARFLQERDEAMTPSDYSDAERAESARLILKQVNEFTVAAPGPVAGDAVAKLPATWRATDDFHGDGDAFADELEAALAQDRASQGAASESTGMRARFDEIEQRVARNEVSPAEVFTQMRTAAIYLRDKASQGAAAGVQEGWRLVPVLPTPAMLEQIKLQEGFTTLALTNRYRAMLAAAPIAPTQGAEREVGRG